MSAGGGLQGGGGAPPFPSPPETNSSIPERNRTARATGNDLPPLVLRFINTVSHRERRCAAPCYGARRRMGAATPFFLGVYTRSVPPERKERVLRGSGCSGARMQPYL